MPITRARATGCLHTKTLDLALPAAADLLRTELVFAEMMTPEIEHPGESQ